MSTLKLTYDLIKPLITWADNIYLKRVPQSGVSPDKTFILLTELAADLEDYGSNSFNSIDFGIQIQIFYATNFNQDYESLEIQLLKKLEANGYRITAVRGHAIDPDTHQDFQTILITKRRFN